jgi:hypothetical protein
MSSIVTFLIPNSEKSFWIDEKRTLKLSCTSALPSEGWFNTFPFLSITFPMLCDYNKLMIFDWPCFKKNPKITMFESIKKSLPKYLN